MARRCAEFPERDSETMTFASKEEVSAFIEKGMYEQTHVVTSVDNKNDDGTLNDGEQVVSVTPWLGFMPENRPEGEVTDDDVMGSIPYTMINYRDHEYNDMKYIRVKSYLSDSLNMKLQYDESGDRLRLRTETMERFSKPFNDDGWTYVPFPFSVYMHKIHINAAMGEDSFGIDDLHDIYNRVRLIQNAGDIENRWKLENILVVSNRVDGGSTNSAIW